MMIKSFKIFERYHNPSKELVDQFDDEFIDEYFDKHCLMDAEQIIDLWPSSIWQFIDDNKYIEDFPLRYPVRLLLLFLSE